MVQTEFVKYFHSIHINKFCIITNILSKKETSAVYQSWVNCANLFFTTEISECHCEMFTFSWQEIMILPFLTEGRKISSYAKENLVCSSPLQHCFSIQCYMIGIKQNTDNLRCFFPQFSNIGKIWCQFSIRSYHSLKRKTNGVPVRK